MTYRRIWTPAGTPWPEYEDYACRRCADLAAVAWGGEVVRLPGTETAQTPQIEALRGQGRAKGVGVALGDTGKAEGRRSGARASEGAKR